MTIGAPVRAREREQRPVPSAPSRVIPFDYGFTFELQGEPGRVLTQTVVVSVEGAFTATAIGYGATPLVERVTFGPGALSDIGRTFVPPPPKGGGAEFSNLRDKLDSLAAAQDAARDAVVARVAPLKRTALVADLTKTERTIFVGPALRIGVGDLIRALARTLKEADYVKDGELGPKTEAALLGGIRLNPDVARFLLMASPDEQLAPGQLDRLFETVSAPPERIQFLYALSDQGTGREFQSAPMLNVAGLGGADGRRPFRAFAQPITFQPRTTIRIDVTEQTEARAALHIALHGYKALGGAGTPTGRVR